MATNRHPHELVLRPSDPERVAATIGTLIDEAHAELPAGELAPLLLTIRNYLDEVAARPVGCALRSA